MARDKAEAKVKKTVEPFESKAVEISAPKPKRVKKVEAPKPEKPVMSEAAPVKKKVAKSKKVIAIDPFSEIVAASSPIKKAPAKKKKAVAKKVEPVAAVPPEEIVLPATVSPAFEALADVRLPELSRGNRARLQMQSPTRLHLYWSLRENPWAMLRDVFGQNVGSYSLVVKLIDVTHGREDIRQCEPVADQWFDVDANTEYRAEIGFYAPNRTYFRVLFSNSVLTPRRAPSTRPATESHWRVSANKFAEVLDVAGFSRDAFDVAMAGDDQVAAHDATKLAFHSMISVEEKLESIPTEDIRYAMLSLASGVSVDELGGRVSRNLINILESNAEKLTRDGAMAALTEHFEIEKSDFTEESVGAAVYGASRVHFPRTMRTRRPVESSARYNPVSSHSR